jgi:hypothetical protein
VAAAGRPRVSCDRELRLPGGRRRDLHCPGRRGLYWVVPSVLVALIFGLVNVRVLLVEILR